VCVCVRACVRACVRVCVCVLVTLYYPGELSDEVRLGVQILESLAINAHIVDGHQHQTTQQRQQLTAFIIANRHRHHRIIQRCLKGKASPYSITERRVTELIPVTHIVTHIVWPHQPENPPGRPRARRISPRRSPSLFPLFNHPLKALMLEATTTPWSS